MNVIIILIILSCSGCTPYFLEPQTPSVVVPESFSVDRGHAAPVAETAAGRWWRQWHSGELDGLMNEALRNNLTLAEAWARLAQAEQLAVQAGAGLRPAVNGTAGYERSEQHYKDKKNIGINNWSLGLTVSYEVDLWQRVRAAKQQAGANVQASREDIDTAFISISGAIAETWVSIIAAQKELALLTAQQELNKQILALILVRFQQAQANILDINQQKQNIAALANAMAVPQAQIGMLRHRLSLLIGRPPQEPLVVSDDLPQPGEALISVPADLLRRRPDIRAALLRLHAAGWQNIQARADLMPRLSLSASYRHSAADLAEIIDNWMVNLAANLVGPIYDGQRRHAEVKRTSSVVDERLASYKKEILTALTEVEDALTAEKRQREILRTLNRQIDLAQAATQDIESRYMGGLSDFLPALHEQVSIFHLRQEKIQAAADLLIARIGLYKATGGSGIAKSQEQGSLRQ